MDKNIIKNLPYREQQLLKDEKSFAFAITTRYKMSNTKNKEFVNCMLLDINEINKYYNLQTLLSEIQKLDFNYIYLKDIKPLELKNKEYYIAIFKNNESRILRFNRVFTVSQFLP